VAEEADYLFVPAIGNSYDEPRAHSLAYVQATWPALWARAGGRDHLMIGCHDAGVSGYFGDRTENEAAMRIIFIGHMGHHIGARKGGTPGGYIPGQDIVIPPSQNLGDVARLPGSYFSLQPGAPPLRPADELARRSGTLLYFAGTVNNNTEEWNVRHQAWLALSGFPDVRIHRGSVGANYTPAMAASLFCLGAPGQGGGWGRRDTLGALHGCIPAFVQDNTSQALDELLPWHLISVRAEQAELPGLHARLAAIRDDAPAAEAMLRQLACAWPRLLPSSSYGALGAESGEDDAFSSVVAILRRRLSREPGSWPENGDVTGPGASAAERQARLRQLQLPDVCGSSSVAWAVEGGEAGARALPPALRLPCRHFASVADSHCPSELADLGGAVCLGVQPPCAWPRRAQPPPARSAAAEAKPPPATTHDAPAVESNDDDYGLVAPPSPGGPPPEPPPAAAVESNDDDWGIPAAPPDAPRLAPPPEPPAGRPAHPPARLCAASEGAACVGATQLQVSSASQWHLSNMEAKNVTWVSSGWVSAAADARLELLLFPQPIAAGARRGAHLLFLCAASERMAAVRVSCAGGCECGESRLDARCAPRPAAAGAGAEVEGDREGSSYEAEWRVEAAAGGEAGAACRLRLAVLAEPPRTGHYYKLFGVRYDVA